MPPSGEGQSFGKYELLARIATGGMAEIWRARLRAAAGLTKPVVIKKVLPAFADDPGFTAMFIQEAAVTVGLSHGNIAQVFDFGQVNGEYFLAMEYVHGHPLSRVLRRAREQGLQVLPEPLALLIGIEVCRGLHYAHTRRDERGEPLHLIHRDVSPQNVVLSYEGQVKLVDFGIAKARTAGRQDTEVGAVKGKYVYFAPEQIRGQPLDARVDVFATGILLYELLCGRLPFDGRMTEVLRRIVQGEMPAPRQLNPHLSPTLERLLLKALATDREQRFASAQALQEALQAELFRHTPPPAPHALALLMGALFEEELAAEGPRVELPRDFLALLERTRRPLPSAPRPPPPGPQGEGDTGSWHPPAPRARPAWLLPVGVALGAGVAALGTVLLLAPPAPMQVELTSTPAGAEVWVDGRAAEAATPVRIEGLAADRAHQLEVRLPGHAPWVHALAPSAGARLALHAALAAPTASAPAEAAPLPAGPLRVEAARHVVEVGEAPFTRVPLAPGRAWQVRREGEATAPILYLLEGAPAEGAPFGVLGPQPVRLEGVRALHLLAVGGGHARPQVRLEDGRGAVQVRQLEPAAGPAPWAGKAARALEGLQPAARYSLALGGGPHSARTRPPPAGPTAQLVVVYGQGQAVRGAEVLTPARPVAFSGASWARLFFLDEARADNAGALEVQLETASAPSARLGPP